MSEPIEITPQDYVEVTFSELKVGDYLVAYESIIDKAWHPVEEMITAVGGEVANTPHHFYGSRINRKYRIRRLGGGVAAINSRYPKKCKDCGKGLYIGMNEIDHEGGPCLKG